MATFASVIAAALACAVVVESAFIEKSNLNHGSSGVTNGSQVANDSRLLSSRRAREFTGDFILTPYTMDGYGDSDSDVARKGWYQEPPTKDGDSGSDSVDGSRPVANPIKGYQPSGLEAMLMMKAMNQMPQAMKQPTKDVTSSSSSGGFLSGFVDDPIKAMLTITLPLSLIIASILPSLITFFTNKNSNGTQPIITTATAGAAARSLFLRNLDVQSPLLQQGPAVLASVARIGAKGLSDPECMMKIFCELVDRKAGDTTKRSRQQQSIAERALRLVAPYVDDSWLKSLKVKDLLKFVDDGKCANVKCTKQSHNVDNQKLQ